MISIEDYTHSFVIRIWLEEKPEKGKQGIWRGEITTVVDNERRYVLCSEDILKHIRPYVERWGVKF